MDHNFLKQSIRFIGRDFIGELIFFPVWWYTLGLKKTLSSYVESVSRKERELAFFLWIRNFFRPMYGQKDWQGRFISLLFRVLILFWKAAWLILWVFVRFTVVFLWFVLPAYAIYRLIFYVF